VQALKCPQFLRGQTPLFFLISYSPVAGFVDTKLLLVYSDSSKDRGDNVWSEVEMVSRTPKRIHRVVMTLAIVTLLVTAVAILVSCNNTDVEVNGLSIDPDTVHPGEDVHISVGVDNYNYDTMHVYINLWVNDVVMGTQEIDVPGRTNERSSGTAAAFFTITAGAPDTNPYRVTVGNNGVGFKYGEYKVISATPSPTPTPTPTPSPSPSPSSTPTQSPPPASPTPTPTPTQSPPPVSTNLEKWGAEAYALVSDEYYSPPSWILSSENRSVREDLNCQPSLFYSDFLIGNSSIHVKIKPLSGYESDDDQIGFALGFQPGDTNNHKADYLLIDWKSNWEDADKDFGGSSCGPGGKAREGLAVSRVTGIPTADEFWQHTDQDVTCSPKNEGLTELARAAHLGSTGWVLDHEYDFSFQFNATSLIVSVDGVPEINIKGNFNDGRLAFYNFSQAGVTYSISAPSTL